MTAFPCAQALDADPGKFCDSADPVQFGFAQWTLTSGHGALDCTDRSSSVQYGWTDGVVWKGWRGDSTRYCRSRRWEEGEGDTAPRHCVFRGRQTAKNRRSLRLCAVAAKNNLGIFVTNLFQVVPRRVIHSGARIAQNADGQCGAARPARSLGRT